MILTVYTKELHSVCSTMFMKCAAAAALNVRISLSPKLHRCEKRGTVMTYSEAVNYVLERYATDCVMK